MCEIKLERVSRPEERNCFTITRIVHTLNHRLASLRSRNILLRRRHPNWIMVSGLVEESVTECLLHTHFALLLGSVQRHCSDTAMNGRVLKALPSIIRQSVANSEIHMLESDTHCGIPLYHLRVLKQYGGSNCGYHSLKNVELAIRACYSSTEAQASAMLKLLSSRSFFWHRYLNHQKALLLHARGKSVDYWPWDAASIKYGELERSYLNYILETDPCLLRFKVFVCVCVCVRVCVLGAVYNLSIHLTLSHQIHLFQTWGFPVRAA
jgi:hypothetical protein